MRWVTNGIGLAVLVLVAGCAGQRSETQQPQAEIPSATSTVSQPPTTPPTSSGEPAEPASTDDCKVDELKLAVQDGDAAAGTVFRKLVFTNSGRRTCVIQGFPGVSYVTGDDGHQVGPAAYRVGTKGAPVRLEPGSSATSDVGFVNVQNYDPQVCRPTPVRGLRVYPPHDTESAFVDLPGTGCAGTPPGNQLTVKTIG
ncbi:DUF4232 domain-containing protein [Actinokineospora terrae]|uniref:DUF4232 domain-containing protein n=1 Tax=Actinokineospora terrae TaxID=155974 RepID=A0A1H9P9E0_9PSEU|nr:DUF4232 domain-containing protein [Actinokineospora terrae]SER44798.1 Protein of unknown function [Actinokineospora terrae]